MSTAFAIKRVTLTENGFTYDTYRLTGWLNGQRIRKQFKSREEAAGEQNRLQVLAANTNGSVRPVMTRLSEDNVAEAEAVYRRLNGVTLTAAVDWYLANYRPPVVSKPLIDATAAFMAEKEPHLSKPVVLAYNRTLKALCEAFVGGQVADVTAEALGTFFDAFNGGSKRRNNLRGELHCFFEWCRGDRRRWIEHNPAKGLPVYKIERGIPAIESAARIAELFAFLETYAGGPRSTCKAGCLVPYFALGTFAGLRPSVPHGEIWKLGQLPDLSRIVDLPMGVIRLSPAVTKTRDVRQVTIQPNLKAWLEKYPAKEFPVVVPGLQGMVTNVRKKFALTDDVLRHTFISMHVAKFGSVGRAALEAGNSERIVKRHYLNMVAQADAEAFWAVAPKA